MPSKPTVNREEREEGANREGREEGVNRNKREERVNAAVGLTVEEERRESTEEMREESAEEESVTEEESVAGKNLKVAYQNVGRSIEATNILLARRREEKWDLVFAAKAWEGRRGERTMQNGYRSYSKPGSKIVLYVREEVNLRTLGPINTGTDWISVSDLITGVYLSPSLRILPLRQQLLSIPATDVVIGDLNCTQQHKRKALLEDARRRDLIEAPIQGKTWRRWLQPQARWTESKPDVIFSRGNWSLNNTEWTISDHAIISGTIRAEVVKRNLLVTDWEAWSDFVEDEEKDTTYPDPILYLRTLTQDNLKAKKFSPKSWWDNEVKEQRKIARRAGRNHGEWRREAAKLRNMIKCKKREHWAAFVQDTVSKKAQDIWRVIKVARNPFNRKCTMLHKLDDAETDTDKVAAIINYNFKGHLGETPPLLHSMKGLQASKEDLIVRLKRALAKTSNTSTPGEDRISYKLLKLLLNTRLGEQTLGFLADFLKGRRTVLLSTGDSNRDLTVVMIPKIGKDQSTVKGWRPIVLMSCLLKLMDKVVAEDLQMLPAFHQGQFGSRKGKSAIDMAIQAVTETQLAMVNGKQTAWALGDIKSAFNYVQKDTVIARLEQLQGEHQGLIRYIHWFFQPRKATIT